MAKKAHHTNQNKKKPTKKAGAKKATPANREANSPSRRTHTDRNDSDFDHFSETIRIPGYVVDADAIRRIDDASRHAVTGGEESQSPQLRIQAIEHDGRNVFENIEDLIRHSEGVQLSPTTLSFTYTSGNARLELAFDCNGDIKLTGRSSSPDIQFDVDAIKREIRECDQDIFPLVRWLVFTRFPAKLLAALIVVASVYLLIEISFYILAWNVAVDIDPELAGSGNEYFIEVEHAIKSGDIANKLDVLLKGQLRSFTNRSTILDRTQRDIVVAVVILVIIGILIGFLRVATRLHPRSYFAIGRNAKVFEKLQRRRDIFLVGIVIAFVVNLIAGIVLALAF